MNNPYASPSADLDAPRSTNGGITAAMIEALRKTKGWVLFLGILLFLGAGFMLLAALGIMAAATLGGGTKSALPTGMIIGMSVFYLVFAVLYVLLGIYLLRYSSAIGRLMKDGDSAAMETALQSQQKFWRMAGIIGIIGVVMGILALAAAVAMPLMLAAKG